ncbi:MAG: DUF2784 domain-containing protein [Burkholderiales bacterium]|nr:DUF2784 domain-containing protein [Burkholderiales bacterium]
MPHALPASLSALHAAALADALLVLHGLFIVWVVLGALAVWRWPRLAWLHLPAAAWGVWIEWSGRICPLTPLEWRLRAAAGQGGEGRASGFIEHYLTAAIYPEGLTRELQWALGALVLLVNLALYGMAVRRRRAGRARIA